MITPTRIMIGIAKRIASGTAQSIIALPVSLAEPVVDVGNLYLERIAEEILLGLVDDGVRQREDPAQRDRAERTDHEQRPMGEVHDAKRSEDQRQTKGDQRIGRSLVQEPRSAPPAE